MIKNNNYSIISNSPLRDKTLSNKALGLLLRMLSLPEDWDYSQKGLAAICQDGEDGIKTQLKELEIKGYLKRNRQRNAKGQITDIEYFIYEEKQIPKEEEKPGNKPSSLKGEFPLEGKPLVGKPLVGKQPQLITNELNTNLLNTQSINLTPKSSEPEPPNLNKTLEPIDTMDTETKKIYLREEIENQLGYEYLCHLYSEERINEIVDIVTETMNTSKPTLRVGGEEKKAIIVQSQYLKLNEEHIMYVIDSIDKGKTEITNILAYLITSLYKAPFTIENKNTHDFNYHNRKYKPP